MSFLAGLLPGIRDLRAPLAAGYLWLLAIWLAVETHIPEQDEASGAFESVYRLGDLVTAIGLGVALSFVAYLLGMLSQGLFDLRATSIQGRYYDLLIRIGPRRMRPRGNSWSPEVHFDVGHISLRGLDSLRQGTSSRLVDLQGVLRDRSLGEFLDAQLPAYTLRWSDDPENHSSVADLGLTVYDELPDVASRLIGKEPELFAAQDRLESEAEFREAIIPPLIGLTAVLAFDVPFAWNLLVVVLGILLAVLVFRRASATRRQRNDLLIDAWYQDRVQAPIWEKLFKAAEMGLSAPPGPPAQPAEDRPQPATSVPTSPPSEPPRNLGTSPQ